MKTKRIIFGKRTQDIIKYISENDPELKNELKLLESCIKLKTIKLFYSYRLKNKDIVTFTCKKNLLCGCCALFHFYNIIEMYKEKVHSIMLQDNSLNIMLIKIYITKGAILSDVFKTAKRARVIISQRRRNSLSASNLNRIKHKSIYRYIKGGIGSFQIEKEKQSDLWKISLHEIAIVDSNDFKFETIERNEKKISTSTELESLLAQELWMVTGESYEVEIKKIEESDMESYKKVFNYNLNVNKLTIQDQVHCYKTLRNHHLCYSYGCLHGLKDSESWDETIDQFSLSLQKELPI